MTVSKIIVVGALFYLLIAPFFFHPDIKIINYLAQYLVTGVFNIYSYIDSHVAAAIFGPFVYPPLAYFIFGIFSPLVKLLAGKGFTEWLAKGNDAVGVTHIFRYLFAMKLPLILVHTATVFPLITLVKTDTAKKLVAFFWFFNPLSIYIIPLMGQIDGLAVLAVVWAVYLAKTKPILSATLLAVGTAIKTFPVLLLPFLVITATSTLKRRIGMIGIFVLTYLLLIGLFLATPEFYTQTFASGLSQRIFQLSLPIGFNESLLLVPFFVLMLGFYAFINHSGIYSKLSNYATALFLILLAGIHFHPQWLLWGLPFLCVYAHTKSRFTLTFIWLILALLIIVTFSDKFLSFGIISPLDPSILFLSPPISLLHPETAILVRNLLVTMFSATSLTIAYDSITKKDA